MRPFSLKNLKLGWALTLVSTLLCHFHVNAVQIELAALTPLNARIPPTSSKRSTLVMIYQPDCTWCKKQGQFLAQAHKLCPDTVNIALIGAMGSTRQLKQELRHYSSAFPAYLADRKFLRHINYQASPTTLIINNQGEVLANQRGFVTSDKLSKAFHILTQGHCQI